MTATRRLGLLGIGSFLLIAVAGLVEPLWTMFAWLLVAGTALARAE